MKKPKITFESIVQRYVQAAIPDPNASKEQLEKRHRILYTFAIFCAIVLIAFISTTFLKWSYQRNIEQAKHLQSVVTCDSYNPKTTTILLCVPEKDWEEASSNDRGMWLSGNIRATSGNVTRIIVETPGQKGTLYDTNSRLRP